LSKGVHVQVHYQMKKRRALGMGDMITAKPGFALKNTLILCGSELAREGVLSVSDLSLTLRFREQARSHSGNR